MCCKAVVNLVPVCVWGVVPGRMGGFLGCEDGEWTRTACVSSMVAPTSVSTFIVVCKLFSFLVCCSHIATISGIGFLKSCIILDNIKHILEYFFLFLFSLITLGPHILSKTQSAKEVRNRTDSRIIFENFSLQVLTWKFWNPVAQQSKWI